MLYKQNLINGIVKVFILDHLNLYHHYFWFVTLCACVFVRVSLLGLLS